ncbi:MAG: dTMP kinase [Terriglobales bacterium]
MIPPAFISFEGLDGSGKSTQVELLAAHLRQHGQQVVTLREPGGTELGERIRSLVLDSRPAPETELALMCASRAQSVREVIAPALEAGAWVLADRFHDATEAYQGGGRGLDRAAIAALHRTLCSGLLPDLTLILELEPAASLERARRRSLPATQRQPERQPGSRAEDRSAPPERPTGATQAKSGEPPSRFEAEGDGFFSRVAAAYHEVAQREPQRCAVIPGAGAPEAIAARVRAVVAERLGWKA